MTTPTRRLAAPALLLVAAVAVAACGGAPSPSPAATETPTVATPAAAAPTGTPAAGATDPGTSTQPSQATDAPAPVAVLTQPWATAELTDVTTGETFTIAGLAASGHTIVLETMAMWCSSCLAQQRRIEEALDRIDRASVAYVVLAVDPSENAATLAQYRERNGFEGRYAVADKAVSRALAVDFGDQVLNPPSTPVILVSPTGRVTRTDYGPKSADQVVSLIEDHRA